MSRFFLILPQREKRIRDFTYLADMKFTFQWGSRGFATSGDSGIQHKDFLQRLRQVPYYGSAERQRELQAGSLEALSPVTLTEYLGSRALFSTRGRVSAAAFEYPVSPAPRTAVLHCGFRSNGAVRAFPEGWSDAVRRFLPEAIAAPVSDLNRLALAVVENPDVLPELRHAAVALIEVGEPLPDDSDRDLWWRAFGVPAFEYIVGPHGGALAMECEAREGLHIVSGRVIFEIESGELLVTPLASSVARLRTGWACQMAAGICPCGRDGARLLDPRPLPVVRELEAQVC